MIPDADSRRSTLIEQVRVRLAELWSYLTANQTRLINYGREYREGHRISTARVGRQTDGLYLEATLQAHQKLRTLLFSSPALAVVQENLHRLIKLLNLQWLLQNRDRTELKNPIEDLTIRVTCDHYNVEVRINLLRCFIHLITGSVRQLQVQKHEIEFLLPEAFNGLFSRTDHHSTEADLLQKCSKQILQAQIVIDH